MGKRKSNTVTADDVAMDEAMAAFMSMPAPGTKKKKVHKEKKKKKVVKVVKKTDDNAPPQQALSVIDLFGEDTLHHGLQYYTQFSWMQTNAS